MIKYLNRACREVNGFAALLQRFERNISVLDHSITGSLITIEVFGKRGPPKQYLPENQPPPVHIH